MRSGRLRPKRWRRRQCRARTARRNSVSERRASEAPSNDEQAGLTRCSRGSRHTGGANRNSNRHRIWQNYDAITTHARKWPVGGRFWRLAASLCVRAGPATPSAPRPPNTSWSTAIPGWRSTASTRSPISPTASRSSGGPNSNTASPARSGASQRGQSRGLRRRSGGLYAALRRLRSGRRRARRVDRRRSATSGSSTTSASISSTPPRRGRASSPSRPRSIASAAARWADGQERPGRVSARLPRRDRPRR